MERGPALKACVDYLTEAINTQSATIHSVKFLQLLRNFSALLIHYGLRINVSSTLKGPFCLYCQAQIKITATAIAVDCGAADHLFCSRNCFKKYVQVATNNTLLELEQVLCPTCRTQIPYAQINELFEGRLEDLQRDACDRALLSLLDAEDRERMRARFTCFICYNDLKVEEGITLDCEHRFCTACISVHIRMLVDSAQVNDQNLKCPSCPEPLSIYILEDTLSPEEFAKYEKFKLRGFCLEEELVFHCLGKDCEYFCILDNDANQYECPQCKFTCCPQCKEEVHLNCSCQEYLEWKEENNTGDKTLDELVRKEGLLKCPVCGALVQRISGCQFITCSSSKCQMTTFLCYICGEKLKGDHAGHDCKPRKTGGVQPQQPVNRPAAVKRRVRRRR